MPLDVAANAHLNTNSCLLSVATLGYIFASIRTALVTFSSYQPTAFAFSVKANLASSNKVFTRYFFVSGLKSAKLTPAFFAAACIRP